MKERSEYDLIATGKNIRKIRKNRNFSVEYVRQYMKLESVQAIYKWEKGKCFPSADNLLALAELYEIDPVDMLIKEKRFYESKNVQSGIWNLLKGLNLWRKRDGKQILSYIMRI